MAKMMMAKMMMAKMMMAKMMMAKMMMVKMVHTCCDHSKGSTRENVSIVALARLKSDQKTLTCWLTKKLSNFTLRKQLFLFSFSATSFRNLQRQGREILKQRWLCPQRMCKPERRSR